MQLPLPSLFGFLYGMKEICGNRKRKAIILNLKTLGRSGDDAGEGVQASVSLSISVFRLMDDQSFSMSH